MPKPKKQTKVPTTKKLSCDVDPDLLDRVRDAVVWLQGEDPQTTMRSFVEDTLKRRLRSIERHHGPIPKRHKKQVRRGRPIE